MDIIQSNNFANNENKINSIVMSQLQEQQNDQINNQLQQNNNDQNNNNNNNQLNNNSNQLNEQIQQIQQIPQILQQSQNNNNNNIIVSPRVFNVPLHSADRDNEILSAMQKRRVVRVQQPSTLNFKPEQPNSHEYLSHQSQTPPQHRHHHHHHHHHHRHHSHQSLSPTQLFVPMLTPSQQQQQQQQLQLQMQMQLQQQRQPFPPLYPFTAFNQLSQNLKPKKVRKSRSPKPPLAAIEDFTDAENGSKSGPRRVSSRIRGKKLKKLIQEDKKENEKEDDLFELIGKHEDELNESDDDKIIDKFIENEKNQADEPKAGSYEELRELRIQRNKKLLGFLNVNDILNGFDNDDSGNGDDTKNANSAYNTDGFDDFGGDEDDGFNLSKPPKKKSTHENPPLLRMSLRNSDNLMFGMLSEEAQENELLEQEQNATALDTLNDLIKTSLSNADKTPNDVPTRYKSSFESYRLLPPRGSKREVQRITSKAQKERSALTAAASQLAIDPNTVCQAHDDGARILSMAVLDRDDLDVVASGTVNGGVSIANMGFDRTCVYKCRPHEKGKAVSSVAFDAASTSVYSAGYDGALMRLDIETGKCTPLLTARPKVSLSAMTLARDDPHIAYCGTAVGGLVVVDDRLPSDTPVAALGCHEQRIMSLESHPVDPSVLVSGSYDGTAALWDLRTLLARVRNTRRAPDITAVMGRKPKGVRGCISTYACEDSAPLVAATVSPFSKMAESPLMVATAKGSIAVWAAVRAVMSSSSSSSLTSSSLGVARSVVGNQDFGINNPNGSANGPVYFHPVWSPHYDGLAAVGSLGRTVSLFGFLPKYLPSPIKIPLKSRGLMSDIPVVNVFHPRHEWSLFSGSTGGYIYHWVNNNDDDDDGKK